MTSAVLPQRAAAESVVHVKSTDGDSSGSKGTTGFEVHPNTGLTLEQVRGGSVRGKSLPFQAGNANDDERGPEPRRLALARSAAFPFERALRRTARPTCANRVASLSPLLSLYTTVRPGLARCSDSVGISLVAQVAQFYLVNCAPT